MPKSLIIIALSLLLVLSGICVLFSKQIFASNDPEILATRNIDGTVTFTVKTATYNGGYAPRNAGVIWITNSQNQFIKTIKVWAQPYRYTLVRWIASSSSNTTGAITGASLNTHQLHTVTWNAKNYQGVTVPDGDYNFNVEFTEHNATTSNMGKYKTLAFTKGSTPINTTYPDETYFRSMSLNWVPIVSDGVITGVVKNASLQPIQGATITAGTSSATSSATGSYSIQIAPGSYNVTCSATGYNAQTQTAVTVTANQTTTLDFSLTSQTGTISGVITDISSQAIPNATITVGTLTATSSATGAYSIVIAPGSYSATCSVSGYTTQTQTGVNVAANQTTPLDFMMSPVSNDDLNNTPAAFVLNTNIPNPFINSTAISYSIAKTSQVSLRIYNLKGQLIRELVNTKQSTGMHHTAWDGTLSNGKKANSGKYIYKLSVDGQETAKTLTFVK